MAKLPWQSRALMQISEHLSKDHTRVTGEEIRFWLHGKRRMVAPNHPNCYGALIRRAIEENLLRPTKEMVPSSVPTSHGRARRVYAVVRPRKPA